MVYSKLKNQSLLNTKIFASIRKGGHAAKTLALPGGHLEMYESWKDYTKREVLEETVLNIHNIEMVHMSNDIMTTEEKYYITICMKAECVNCLESSRLSTNIA